MHILGCAGLVKSWRSSNFWSEPRRDAVMVEPFGQGALTLQPWFSSLGKEIDLRGALH